jgi:hypothetical protein
MDNKLNCVVCKITTATLKKYEAHCLTSKHKKLIESNGQEHQVECKICNIKFVCQNAYNIHTETKKHKNNVLFKETGITNTICLYCDYKSDNHSNLIRHHNVKHDHLPKIDYKKIDDSMIKTLYNILFNKKMHQYIKYTALKSRLGKTNNLDEDLNNKLNVLKNNYIEIKEIISKFEKKYKLNQNDIIDDDQDDEQDYIIKTNKIEYAPILTDPHQNIKDEINIKKEQILKLQNVYNEICDDLKDTFSFIIKEIKQTQIDINNLENKIIV